MSKQYEGHPWVKNLPWYVKFVSYIASIIIFGKLGLWVTVYCNFSVYAMFPVMIAGPLTLLYLLGPPKEDRENPRLTLK